LLCEALADFGFRVAGFELLQQIPAFVGDFD
jgi:hypothetical protein